MNAPHASHHLERILCSSLFCATNFLIARKLPKAEAGASTLSRCALSSPPKMARHFLVRRNYPVDGRNLSQKQILKRHTVARCAYRTSKRRRKIASVLDLRMFALARLSFAKSMLNRLTLGDDGRCVVCTELFVSAWFRSLLKQRQLFQMRRARRFSMAPLSDAAAFS